MLNSKKLGNLYDSELFKFSAVEKASFVFESCRRAMPILEVDGVVSPVRLCLTVISGCHSGFFLKKAVKIVFAGKPQHFADAFKTVVVCAQKPLCLRYFYIMNVL